ncbi:hypothetical protein Back11_52400 [Paenibacillus baekrokdamisoli]|uniref:Uncharacterized protein n=1 Tax=Paenibacillus baekrokdamisoli TaxID=1712516 RepID=A0A3G9J6G9_9BACL|nr:Ig-like domain-containing protein [Paenibacillus baekrokdamisoli]MBB3069078.1 putative repeat protein (TIGR02059 family) [Paenibacillus baekrokdamisoli]BBH23895.1 hypothetical protein Back11_52400 [Paenibacillus baekrokdamisoli]
MVRNHRKCISYLLVVILMVQFGIGGFTFSPTPAAAATAGPVVLSTSPSTSSTNVPTNAKLILTFDENVKKGTGPATLTIKRLGDNQLFQSYVVSSDSKVSIGASSKNVVTITPSTSFDLNTSYYVTIDAGAFINESNNANYAGMNSTLTWNFTTVAVADIIAPTLASKSPFTPSTASVNTPLTLNFSEPVYAANGSITVTNMSVPGDVQSIPVVSSNVTGNGSATITVNLPGLLQGSSNYEVIVPSGAFQDGAGNNFAGVSSSQWRFITDAPPLGTPILSPLTNSFSVNTTANLVLTFPSAVVINTASTGSIRINKISDNSTVQTLPVNSSYVTVDATGTIVTINPPADLAANTGFYVLIDSGVFKDKTDSTILYQGIIDATAWHFTTDPGNDVTPPTLIDRKPLNVQATPTLNLEMNFSEPVYPGSGNIVIKSLPSGSVFTTIPVTSSKVKGGGTNKITVVDANLSFVNNTSYYVEIGGQAFRDAAGNNYAGIAGSNGWSFIITQDSVKPTLTTQTPANTSINIGINGVVLEALFSEQIQLGASASTAVKVKRISGTGNSPLSTTLSIDPLNNRKLLIAINGDMAANTDYYVEMAEGTVTDMAGNRFDGILNQYQWTFKTTNTAAGAPVISKAEMVGYIKVNLTFNKALNTNSVPVPANFYVTVNGSGRAVSSVAVSGTVVSLTLQSSVSYGQAVKVSYSAGSNAILDLTGLAAANFSNRDVTNVLDNTPPVQVSGSISGNLIVLSYSKELAAVSPYAYSQFTVYLDGSARTVTQVTGSGNVLFLNYSGNPVTNGQSVYVSYYASSYPIRDLAGNAGASFSSFYIQNGLDTKAPLIQSVSALNSQITLTYDEALNSSLIPKASSFYVLVNGTNRSVSYVSVSGTQVILNLGAALNASDNVIVTYLGGTPAIADSAGNAAAAFSGMTATAGGSSSGISLNGAVAKASMITLTFSTILNPSYVPYSSQFTVKVNNVTRPVSNATISGSSVILTLYTPVAIGDTIKVSYASSGLSLRALTGALVTAFTDTNAANQTTWSDNMSGDFEAADGGGLSIKQTAVTKVNGVSPAGKSANQYVLSAEKVAAAFNTVRSVSGMSPRVVFTVPTTENAGLVAISLSALEDAKKTVSNGSIAIVYKDTSYEIPLSALNFPQLAQLANASSAVGQLYVSIDMNATNLAAPLTAALNSANAQMLVSPVSFDLSVNSNGQSKSLDTLSGFVTRTIKTASNLDARSTAVVWLDPQTNKLTYAPTQVAQVNGQSVVTFKRKGNSVYTVIKGAVNFTDITNHWARNDILLLANKYIVEGSTLTAFAPEKSITRGEFAMFIAKGLGLNGDKQAAAKFKDVNTSTTLAAYIGAASNAGIVQGMTDGTFKPNRTVTREEMASMMVRAASAAEVQITLSQNATTILKKFKDSNKIGTWAQTDVAKAVQMGVINGLSTGAFGGQTAASRAQAAVMIKRLLDYLHFINV